MIRDYCSFYNATISEKIVRDFQSVMLTEGKKRLVISIDVDDETGDFCLDLEDVLRATKKHYPEFWNRINQEGGI